jgi:hypothetical protein
MDENARNELESIYTAITALNIRVEALRRFLGISVQEMELKLAEVRAEYLD